MEDWVRQIAAAYGVSYDAFLKHALGRTGRGARDLDRISDAELIRLSTGTGVSIERMREMNGASIQARMNALQDGPLTEEGGAALDELRGDAEPRCQAATSLCDGRCRPSRKAELVRLQSMDRVTN